MSETAVDFGQVTAVAGPDLTVRRAEVVAPLGRPPADAAGLVDPAGAVYPSRAAGRTDRAVHRDQSTVAEGARRAGRCDRDRDRDRRALHLSEGTVRDNPSSAIRKRLEIAPVATDNGWL